MAQSVAKGSIELELDASKLNSQMGKQIAKAKKDGKTLGERFKESGNEKVGELFGGGSIVGMASKAGLVGAAVAVGAFVGKELYEELIVKTKEYSRELEANERAVSKWGDSVRDKYDSITESLTEFSAVAGTSAGIKANEQALAKMRGELEGVTAAKQKQEEAEKSYDSKWSSGRNFELWLSSRLESTQASEANKKKELIGLEDELRKKFEQQAKVLARLQNPLTNPAAKAALADFIRGQEDAIAAAEGRTAEEQQLIGLQRQFNWKDAQLAEARATVERKKMAEATKEAKDWVKELTDEVGLYNNGVAVTAEEKKLADLISKGADEREIARIKQLIALKEKQAETYKPLQALERGTAQELSFQYKAKFDEEKSKDLQQQLEQLRQQNNWLSRIYIRIANPTPEPAV